MSRLRLAVVGAGHLGRIHARIASALDDIQLAAVVDPIASARDSVAMETGAKALADHRGLFGTVDAAVIATPTSDHARIANELLSGGLHLLVEKPITANSSEAQELVELANRQQLVLQVGHVERFNPAYTSARSRLHDPKFIEARRLSAFTFRSTDIGVVMDLMIHDIDAVLNLVRSPLTHVEALGISVLGDQEDIVNARLQFASGCVVNLTASRLSYVAERSMQVFTPECFATIDFAARQSSIVEPTQEILRREFEAISLSAERKEHVRDRLFVELLARQDLSAEESNAIEEEQLDFAHAICSGESPRVTGSDGRDAVAVAEQILQCVEAHQWDGAEGTRQGAFALPLDSTIFAGADDDAWSMEDTVVMRRKAG